MPEVVVDFYDRLKSATSGYASLSYEMTGYVKNDLVKMDILIAGDLVEPFAQIVPRFQAERRGRALTEKLKEIVPRQMFAVSVQAAIGGKIIAREDIPAMRKRIPVYFNKPQTSQYFSNLVGNFISFIRCFLSRFRKIIV